MAAETMWPALFQAKTGETSSIKTSVPAMSPFSIRCSLLGADEVAMLSFSVRIVGAPRRWPYGLLQWLGHRESKHDIPSATLSTSQDAHTLAWTGNTAPRWRYSRGPARLNSHNTAARLCARRSGCSTRDVAYTAVPLPRAVVVHEDCNQRLADRRGSQGMSLGREGGTGYADV